MRPSQAATPHRPGPSRHATLGWLALAAILLGVLVLTGCTVQPERSRVVDTAATLEPGPQGEEVAVITTNHGVMAFRFFPDGAPKTVAHVRQLIADEFFDGKIFYRVVAGHVIQGGEGADAEGGATVVGEFGAHPHVPGAVGLARDADPDSGSTEIYICLEDRPHLDGSYAIFGLLVEGFDVLAKIGAVPVKEQWEGPVAFHRPLEPVVIESIRLERRVLSADS